ncbi:MAG: M48 family metalloprotease, partial [Alphaproteobacteria bacterium]
MIRRALIAAAVAAALAGTGAGCTTNPATGEQSFTGTMGTAEEISLGQEQHPKVIKAFDGIYGTPALGKYVDGVGQLLAGTTERRGIKYRFTVLNSAAVNAFALPGGYIYITRGLLALAGNEAELAAVLAHELGHVTALHHAQRAGHSLLANVLITGLGIAGGRIAADTSAALAQGLLQSFSREHEHESDDLGIRYMVRAGYDPLAMAAFLRKLRADSRLQARLRGKSPDKIDQFNYLATHPAPIERVRRAEANARGKRRRNAMLAEDIYLGNIDGILYGDDPRQGYVRGRVFSH